MPFDLYDIDRVAFLLEVLNAGLVDKCLSSQIYTLTGAEFRKIVSFVFKKFKMRERLSLLSHLLD